MHSAQSIKMQMSFIRRGNVCVRRESVFSLSMGRSAPTVLSVQVCMPSWMLYKRRGGGYNEHTRDKVTLERDRDIHDSIYRRSLLSSSRQYDRIFILRPIGWINGNLEDRIRGIVDFQGGTKSILIDICLESPTVCVFVANTRALCRS